MFVIDDKSVVRSSMVRRYNKGAYTHDYIFGFARGGLVYAVQVNNAGDLLNGLTYAEKRSGGWTLRYRPTKAQQELILANASRVEILGTLEWLEDEKLNFKNNRGDAFEHYACKRWNGEQPANRAEKFTTCGDFWTKDGTHFQCKYGASTGAATFTDEKTLTNLGL
jgi:hypothetical protein